MNHFLFEIQIAEHLSNSFALAKREIYLNFDKRSSLLYEGVVLKNKRRDLRNVIKSPNFILFFLNYIITNKKN